MNKIKQLGVALGKGPAIYTKSIRDDKILIAWMLSLILIRIWLVQSQDLIATSTPVDDYLFIKLARNILNGEWLGQYDQFTLVKGPGFPLFIAAANIAGIPLMLAEHLLFSLTCVLTIVALNPLFKNRVALMIIFLFLLFTPILYMYPATGRVFRFGITIPLVLAVFACGIGLLVRASMSFRKVLGWAVLFGMSFTYLWFTREEGIWMLPAMSLFGIYFFIVDSDYSSSQHLKRLACLISIPLIFFGAQSILKGLNEKYYGAPVIIELKSPEFQSALGGLMAIDGKGSTRLLPVSWGAQTAGMEVSPSLKELSIHMPDNKKAKYMNSFYIWHLRDVVRKSGNADTLPEALEFYRKVGDELAQACNSGSLNCLDRNPSIRPVWKKEYNSMFPSAFWEVFVQAVSFNRLHMSKNYFLKYTTSAKASDVYDYKFVTREHLTPGHTHHIEQYPPFYKRIMLAKFRILSSILDTYKDGAPYLFTFAVVCNIGLFALAVKKGSSMFQPIVGVLILAGIFTLVTMLTYIRITLWPINRPLTPAYLLVVFYIALMVSFLICEIIRLRKSDPAIVTSMKTKKFR